MKLNIEINEEDMIIALISSYKYLKYHPRSLCRGKIKISEFDPKKFNIDLNDTFCICGMEYNSHLKSKHETLNFGEEIFSQEICIIDIRILFILLAETNNKRLKTTFDLCLKEKLTNPLLHIQLSDIKYGKVDRTLYKYLVEGIYNEFTYYNSRNKSYYDFNACCYELVHDIYCDYDKW